VVRSGHWRIAFSQLLEILCELEATSRKVDIWCVARAVSQTWPASPVSINELNSGLQRLGNHGFVEISLPPDTPGASPVDRASSIHVTRHGRAMVAPLQAS